MIEMKKDYEKLMEDIRKINSKWDVFYDEGDDFLNGDEYFSNVKICENSESSAFINIFDDEYFVIEEIVFDFEEKKELMELVEDFIHEPEGIKCPLCDGIAEYRQGIDGSVHAWVCTDCAFVGFEFYDGDNYLALGEMLDVVK